jgi:hypothetical protein
VGWSGNEDDAAASLLVHLPRLKNYFRKNRRFARAWRTTYDVRRNHGGMIGSGAVQRTRDAVQLSRAETGVEYANCGGGVCGSGGSVVREEQWSDVPVQMLQ